jgi:hypothetical protein
MSPPDDCVRCLVVRLLEYSRGLEKLIVTLLLGVHEHGENFRSYAHEPLSLNDVVERFG